MSPVEKTLSQQEVEQLVHDILEDDTRTLDKDRTLAALRAKAYGNPERELARIEAEFRTPRNLLIADQHIGEALDKQIVAAESRVKAQLLTRRPHRPIGS